LARKLAKIALFLVPLLSFALLLQPALDFVFGLSYLPFVALNRPQLLDMNGNQANKIDTSQQGVVGIAVTNNLDIDQPIVILIDIRNGAGVTEYLAWQSGKVAANGTYNFESSWMPSKGCFGTDIDWRCTYEIRAFAVSNLTNPQVLSDVVTRYGIIVTDTQSQGDRLYTLVLDDSKYDIKYSMGSGNIHKIIADPDIGAMMFQLDGVHSDTELSLMLPTHLVDLFYKAFPSGSYIEPEIFIDTLPAREVSLEITQNNTMWVIPIRAGAEEIEFAFPWLI
jgi:hypothetical protein